MTECRRHVALTIALAFCASGLVVACHSSGKTNGCAPPFDLTVGHGVGRVSLLADCGGDVGRVPPPTITIPAGVVSSLQNSGHAASPPPVLRVAPAGVVPVSNMALVAEHPGTATVSIGGWRCASGDTSCVLLVVRVP